MFVFRIVLCSSLSTLLHAGLSLLGVGSLSSAQRDSSLTALPLGSFLPPNATFAFNHSQSSLLTSIPAVGSDSTTALFTRVEGTGMLLSLDRVLMQSAGGLWMHEKEQQATFTRGSASLRFHFLNPPAGPDDRVDGGGEDMVGHLGVGGDDGKKAILSITHRDTSTSKSPHHEGDDDRNAKHDDSVVLQSVVDITSHSIGHDSTGHNGDSGSDGVSGSSSYYVVTVMGSVMAHDYLLLTTTPSSLPSSSSSSSVVRDLILLNQSVTASSAAADDDDDHNHFDYHDTTATPISQSESTLSMLSALTVLTRAVNHR